ncbi:MAG: hypothetical protein QW534_08655 [Candidatus Methanomethylicia archaeon]
MKRSGICRIEIGMNWINLVYFDKIEILKEIELLKVFSELDEARLYLWYDVWYHGMLKYA